jgi:hypothetical protein
MQVITRQTQANGVVERWAHQYPVSANYGNDKQKILRELKELGDVPSPDAVNTVIGNESWTKTECNQCGAVNALVVRVGQEPNHDSYTASLCKACLEKALALVNEQEKLALISKHKLVTMNDLSEGKGATLSATDVAYIWQLNGLVGTTAISKAFGITVSAIRDIWKQITWKRTIREIKERL